PDDAQSTTQAIQSAKQAGIPLPSNVPSSALLGGSIKRLGKQKSRPKLDEDWGMDFDAPVSSGLQLKKAKLPDMPEDDFNDMDFDAPSGQLELKKHKEVDAEDEDFDDFGELEGSLGIRFAGTKRDGRGRSSSASAMSPSAGS
ncbi:hypothetical protein LTR53_019481, partial [Teratosphaeriaceae sp. CCFEE 6253]